ncbi:MAG: F0F1 ATP synthase subunit delta [Deltaproteobacteria bacterium]|jgi:F-type H+-transporting ATPase subunit delta|nr:F0F1 ATP synthase subunit delta [Deltaproteobacteria bacterium]
MQGILAKRYAQALFDLGQEEGSVRAWGQELQDFSLSLAGSEEGSILSSLVYPRELRSRILEAVLKAAGLSERVQNFLRLLLERGRLNILGEIAAAYQRLADDKEGLIRGTVTAAEPLDDGQLAALKSVLSTFAGRKVELSVKQDPALIGGVVAKLGDLVIDGSLRSRLNRMSRQLGEI